MDHFGVTLSRQEGVFEREPLHRRMSMPKNGTRRFRILSGQDQVLHQDRDQELYEGAEDVEGLRDRKNNPASKSVPERRLRS